MKRFALGWSGALAICALAVAGAKADTSVNFDDLALGPVTNQYAAQGLSFDGRVSVLNETVNGQVIVASPPNYLDLRHEFGQSTVTFVLPSDPNVPGLTNFLTLTNLAINAHSGGWYNGIDFEALSYDGNVLDMASISPTTSGQSRAAATITLSGPGIHKVRMTVFPSPSGSAALAPMDDWTFGEITAVPEPGCAALAVGALAVVGTRARRRRTKIG